MTESFHVNSSYLAILIAALVIVFVMVKSKKSEKQDGMPTSPPGGFTIGPKGGAPLQMNTDMPEPPPPTVAPAFQTKAPEISTLPASIGIDGSYDPAKPWLQQPQRWYGGPSQPVFAGPAEHPFDPKYPQLFPGAFPLPSTGGEPVISMQQRETYWSRFGSGLETKPNPPPESNAPSTPAPVTNPPLTNGTTQPPGSPSVIRSSPYNAAIPHELPATESNIYAISKDDNVCPAVPPRGKLELAIKAWTVGRRSGQQSFDVGQVDMGVDGGWFDMENKGCCDHYCRRVGSGSNMYWSCITPQAPDNEYSVMKPNGMRCTSFAGAPSAMGSG